MTVKCGTGADAAPATVAFELEGTVLAAKEVAHHDAPGSPLGDAVLRALVSAGREHVPGVVERDIGDFGHGQGNLSNERHV